MTLEPRDTGNLHADSGERLVDRDVVAEQLAAAVARPRRSGGLGRRAPPRRRVLRERRARGAALAAPQPRVEAVDAADAAPLAAVDVALGADGREVLSTQLLVLTESQQSFEFKDLSLQAGEEPVPSILRGFSAPVVLEKDFTSTQLLTLLAHDTDPFNQWEAAQRLCLNAALTAVAATDTPTHVLDAALVQALRTVLRNPALDAAFKDLVLTLPSETYIAEQLDVVDPQRIHAVREAMRTQLARELHDDWVWAFEAHSENGAFSPDPASSGRRALSGMALTMLCLDARTTGDEVWPGRTFQCFNDAHNMTDRFNALSALVQAQSVSAGHDLATDALQRFYNLFHNEALVMDKWFALQAGGTDRGGNILSLVRNLKIGRAHV